MKAASRLSCLSDGKNYPCSGFYRKNLNEKYIYILA